jgi:hypothetical protein
MARRNREDEDVDRNGQREADFDYDRSRVARPDRDGQEFTRESWGRPGHGPRGREQDEYGRGFERGFHGEFDGGYGRGAGQGFERGSGSGGYDQWGQEAGRQWRGGFERGFAPRRREVQHVGGEQRFGERFEGGRGEHTGHGPKGYARSDDRVREDICERLTEHGEIDARELEVTVQDGEVTLSGTITSRRAKRMVEDVAEEVSGVKDVHNQLRVKQSGDHGGSGQERESGSHLGGSRGEAR